jgi:hypothetical protein
MYRTKAILTRTFILAAVLAPAIWLGTPAEAQYPPPPPPPAQYVAPPPPPDAYVATTQPEYYENRPVYWYGGNWFYRDEHGRWNFYRQEPSYLRDRRAHWDDRRRYHYYR